MLLTVPGVDVETQRSDKRLLLVDLHTNSDIQRYAAVVAAVELRACHFSKILNNAA